MGVLIFFFENIEESWKTFKIAEKQNISLHAPCTQSGCVYFHCEVRYHIVHQHTHTHKGECSEAEVNPHTTFYRHHAWNSICTQHRVAHWLSVREIIVIMLLFSHLKILCIFIPTIQKLLRVYWQKKHSQYCIMELLPNVNTELFFFYTVFCIR